jgi:hypothetical protein
VVTPLDTCVGSVEVEVEVFWVLGGDTGIAAGDGSILLSSDVVICLSVFLSLDLYLVLMYLAK